LFDILVADILTVAVCSASLGYICWLLLDICFKRRASAPTNRISQVRRARDKQIMPAAKKTQTALAKGGPSPSGPRLGAPESSNCLSKFPKPDPEIRRLQTSDDPHLQRPAAGRNRPVRNTLRRQDLRKTLGAVEPRATPQTRLRGPPARPSGRAAPHTEVTLALLPKRGRPQPRSRERRGMGRRAAAGWTCCTNARCVASDHVAGVCLLAARPPSARSPASRRVISRGAKVQPPHARWSDDVAGARASSLPAASEATGAKTAWDCAVDIAAGLLPLGRPLRWTPRSARNVPPRAA